MSTPARILMVEGDTVPSSPTSGQILLYAKTSGTFYSLDSSGTETPLSGGGGGSGTVTSVSVSTVAGVSGSVATATTTPAITITLGAITPTSVAASGTVTGSNLSGTNTGDNSVNTLYSGLVTNATHTGDATGATALTLATVATGATTGSSTAIPVVTFNNKGLVTAITTAAVVAPAGTLTGATLAAGVTASSLTSVGTLAVLTVTAAIAGSVTGSSGSTTGNASTVTTNADLTGDVTSTGNATTLATVSIAKGGTGQTTAGTAINALMPSQTANAGKLLTTDGTTLSWIPTSSGVTTLTGDVAGTGSGTIPTTLATVNLSPGVYGDDHLVPTITVNAKGLVTLITTQHVDTTVIDLVSTAETFVVSTRHQYIVTGELEIDGLIENYGVIAIL